MRILREVLQQCRSELESFAAYQAWRAEQGLPLDRAAEERLVDYKEYIGLLLALVPNLSQGAETSLFDSDDLGGGDISLYRPIDDAALRPYLATVACLPRQCIGRCEGEYYAKIFLGRIGNYFIRLTDFIPADLPTMVLVGEAEGHLVLVRARDVETYYLAAGEDGQQPSRY